MLKDEVGVITIKFLSYANYQPKNLKRTHDFQNVNNHFLPESFLSNETHIEDKNETTIKGINLLMNCFLELLLI